jgi:hypothetical protein
MVQTARREASAELVGGFEVERGLRTRFQDVRPMGRTHTQQTRREVGFHL